MAAGREVLRLEIRLAIQLHDAGRDHIGVLLLLIGMLEKFGPDGIREYAVDGEVVALGAQHADELGRQDLVQNLDHLLAIGLVAGRDGAVADLGAGPVADLRDVGNEGLHGDSSVGTATHPADATHQEAAPPKNVPCRGWSRAYFW